MPTRNQFYALVHMGAARLGYKEPDEYRAWLQSLTGKQSATECTLLELNGLVSTLRGALATSAPNRSSSVGQAAAASSSRVAAPHCMYATASPADRAAAWRVSLISLSPLARALACALRVCLATVIVTVPASQSMQS